MSKWLCFFVVRGEAGKEKIRKDYCGKISMVTTLQKSTRVALRICLFNQGRDVLCCNLQKGH